MEAQGRIALRNYKGLTERDWAVCVGEKQLGWMTPAGEYAGLPGLSGWWAYIGEDPVTPEGGQSFEAAIAAILRESDYEADPWPLRAR